MTGTDLAAAHRALWHRRRQTIAFLRIAWRIVVAVARGLRRGLRLWWRWVRASELDAAVRAASSGSAGTPGAGLAGITADRYQRRHRRIRAALTVAVLIAVSVALLVALLTVGALIIGPAAGLPTLAAGARAGRRDGERMLTGPRKPGKASQDMVSEAMRAAGVIAKSESLRFVTPVAKDGADWAVIVDLPPGKKAATAVAARESIASALAVDEAQLELARVRGQGGHAGRLSIWCSGSDPYAAKPEGWPLVDADSWDFWNALPFGKTGRGRSITLAMLWTHLLIGAIPRMGKTFAARLVAAAAALDPYVRAYVYDGKGGIDWLGFQLIAHRFGRGVRPETVARVAADLEELVGEMNDRYDRLAELGPELAPEGKVTPQITRDPALNMPLILVTIDEVHRYLESRAPSEVIDERTGKARTQGARILDALVELAKVGPAVGIILVLATQKPDSDAIPTELRDVLGTRGAGKTMTWQASDTILGAGAYKAGLDASKLLRSHKGVLILLGADDEAATDEPVTIRTYLLDGPGVLKICERGRKLREQAGTLSGDALGFGSTEPSAVSVLERAVEALGEADRIASADLAEALGTDQTALAGELAAFQVRPRVVRIGEATPRGYYRADLEAALRGPQQVAPPETVGATA